MKRFYKTDSLDPDYPPVSLAEARIRLVAFGNKSRCIYHRPSHLADVIWPGRRFRSAQGAARAATSILKRLSIPWQHCHNDWGYILPVK